MSTSVSSSSRSLARWELNSSHTLRNQRANASHTLRNQKGVFLFFEYLFLKKGWTWPIVCLKIELRQSIWKGWRQSSPNGHVRCQSSYPYLRELRAECQSVDYDSKTERQITFATDSDNATTSERELAAKEDKKEKSLESQSGSRSPFFFSPFTFFSRPSVCDWLDFTLSVVINCFSYSYRSISFRF